MLIIDYLLIAVIGILLLLRQTKWGYIVFVICLVLTFTWFLHHATDNLRLNL